MKTITNTTIMSLLLTLVMMVSCSTEGDVLDDMAKVEVPATSGIAAAISCSINNVMTKTGETTQPADSETNEAIKSVIFFLMKDNLVLGCKEGEAATILTKKQNGLTVIAVANASTTTRSALLNATTRNDINNIALGSDDLESLIKIGESVEIENFVENGSTFTAAVAVTVNQIAARIDLNTLTVNVKAADSKVVKLTAVTLENQNVAGKMSGEVASFVNGNVNGTLNVDKLTSGQAYKNICHFYTFANDATSPTTMVLDFEVDGVSSSRKFEIKHSNDGTVVKSGYLYRLNITVNVYGENVEPEVTFEVADWKTSTVSGSLGEVTM